MLGSSPPEHVSLDPEFVVALEPLAVSDGSVEPLPSEESLFLVESDVDLELVGEVDSVSLDVVLDGELDVGDVLGANSLGLEEDQVVSEVLEVDFVSPLHMGGVVLSEVLDVDQLVFVPVVEGDQLVADDDVGLDDLDRL